MADRDNKTIYRECVTLHYWGSHGNGVGLLAKVDFYNSMTCIRWLPQSRENAVVAIAPETLKQLSAAIDEDSRRIGRFLTPSLSDEDEHDDEE